MHGRIDMSCQLSLELVYSSLERFSMFTWLGLVDHDIM